MSFVHKLCCYLIISFIFLPPNLLLYCTTLATCNIILGICSTLAILFHCTSTMLQRKALHPLLHLYNHIPAHSSASLLAAVMLTLPNHCQVHTSEQELQVFSHLTFAQIPFVTFMTENFVIAVYCLNTDLPQ